MDIKDVEFNSNYVVGKITIPSVHLNLPILYGVSNNNLWFGACTMKPNQKFGQGNFALAGHTMANQNLLFTPLHFIKKAIGSILQTAKIFMFIKQLILK